MVIQMLYKNQYTKIELTKTVNFTIFTSPYLYLNLVIIPSYEFLQEHTYTYLLLQPDNLRQNQT